MESRPVVAHPYAIIVLLMCQGVNLEVGRRTIRSIGSSRRLSPKHNSGAKRLMRELAVTTVH